MCHARDNRWCWEETHLRYDTRSRNLEDIKKNDRIYRKLNQSMANEIRTLAATGELRQTDIAAQYGVTQRLVSCIHRGTMWRIGGKQHVS